MEIEINGIKYREKEQPKRKPISKTLLAMLTMASMFDYGSGTGSKETPNVDIVKEYGLIQQKKSNLSKSQREWVVWQFKRKFEPIQ